MKRIIGLLTVTAACALASTASAYLDPTSVDGDGRAVDQVLTFGARLGSPANNVNIQAIRYTSDPDDQAWGDINVSGTDANGTHSYDASVVCLHVDATGTNATLLAKIDTSAGEPTTLAGVLVHLTDPEALVDEGVAGGDRIDITNLNLAQLTRQRSAGCATTQTAKTPVVSPGIMVLKWAPFFG
jgi:hypothetical protein